MHRFSLLTIVLLSVFSSAAQSLQTPQPSPVQTVKQHFGIGSIELVYSRPGLKGRKLGKDLAPYGQVWRTGANAATTIEFSDEVTIGNAPIPAGKYGILSIPNESEWTIIITKDLNINNPGNYQPSNDVVRVKLPVSKLSQAVETFTLNFDSFTNESCLLQLSWGNSAVALPITTNTDDKVMKQISSIFSKDSKPYYNAAQYYFDNGKDLKLAKQWIDIASEDPQNAKALHVFWLKARVHQQLNEKDMARTAAEKTIAIGKEARNEEYVKMATDLLNKL